MAKHTHFAATWHGSEIWRDDGVVNGTAVRSLVATFNGTAERDRYLRIINAHDALVRALESLLRYGMGPRPAVSGSTWRAIEEHARAALALAKGE
jgi:hypothetical protein